MNDEKTTPFDLPVRAAIGGVMDASDRFVPMVALNARLRQAEKMDEALEEKIARLLEAISSAKALIAKELSVRTIPTATRRAFEILTETMNKETGQ